MIKKQNRIAEAVMRNGKEIPDPHGGPSFAYKCWGYVSCCRLLCFFREGKREYFSEVEPKK